MMRQVMLQGIIVLAAMLLPSVCRADSSAWLGPQPSGSRYPDGEADRQYVILIDDLAHRDTFRRVAGETFRREALILDSDRDPLDVILRRAEVVAGRHSANAENAGPGPGSHRAGRLAGRGGHDRRQGSGRAAVAFSTRFAACGGASHCPTRCLTSRTFFSSSASGVASITCAISTTESHSARAEACSFSPMRSARKRELRDLLADAVVGNGRLQGQKLTGGPRRSWNLTPDINHNDLYGEETQGGSFLSPALSYDGKTVVFAYVECQGGRKHLQHTDPQKGHWDMQRCYHLFSVGRTARICGN